MIAHPFQTPAQTRWAPDVIPFPGPSAGLHQLPAHRRSAVTLTSPLTGRDGTKSGVGQGTRARPVVCPAKARVLSRRQTYRGKSQKPRSLDSRGEGNRASGAYRRSHLRDGSELPGCSGSERTGGPESEEPRRPSPQPEGRRLHGGVERWLRRLAHSGGVGATAWRQGHTEQLEKPSSPRCEIGGAR
jgi:hypothetical protein